MLSVEKIDDKFKGWCSSCDKDAEMIIKIGVSESNVSKTKLCSSCAMDMSVSIEEVIEEIEDVFYEDDDEEDEEDDELEEEVAPEEEIQATPSNNTFEL